MQYVEHHLDQERKKPFFVSIITMTSHEPFNNFQHFVSDGRFDDVEPTLTGRYFASLAYTDQAVKALVAGMQKKYPDTYFFLYGDHTPYVINEGAFRRSVLRDAEEKEMVPLFIITPSGQKRVEHDAVASYLDFAPTVLHAAGIPYRYRSLGVDLFQADQTLRQPVLYRGRKLSRSELFREMSETYGSVASGESVRHPGNGTQRRGLLNCFSALAESFSN
jgi:phosphoglycerol transferase MdoB-like AlkP superfamily enzyme